VTDVLAGVSSILLIDYPGIQVPEGVARAGFTTTAHEGPGPDEYYAYEVAGDVVRRRKVGAEPVQVDLVYTYRPVDELPGIVEHAQQLGARAVWFQDDGSIAGAPGRAREIVEAAGLAFGTGALLDVVRGRAP
jgi:hypothetical protein